MNTMARRLNNVIYLLGLGSFRDRLLHPKNRNFGILHQRLVAACI